MDNKTVHIISHSHWDREWYMPFEKFRIRLVQLIDRVMELLEAGGNGFEYFHMDGHVLPIDDYLEIRPEQESRIRKLVEAGKLFVGPWYVLQDAFLTSGEAQIRNLQIGMRRAEQLGGVAKIGYYPDTFGNISQTAQLLRGFGIDAAVFGRGINAIAENNTVVADAIDRYPSELWWEAPDGSKVLSVFLANWYHNGMELPTDPEAARERAEVMLANVERVATTRHLLLMNGCDHQPVQANVGQAIDELNRVRPGYSFVHSHFPQYFEALRSAPAEWPTVTGELIGEYTTGWGTLVNTASARMHLKQWNVRLQTEMERWVEPFTAIAGLLGGTYPEAFVRHAWKLLLQNHPHDSICGCSVDEVHEEMLTRYRKAWQIAESLSGQALASIAASIDTASLLVSAGAEHAKGAAIPIVVFNPLGWERSEWVTAEVEVEEEIQTDQWVLLDGTGDPVPYDCEDRGWVHGFTLPDDKFRIPWKKRRYILRFPAGNVPAVGHRSLIWLEKPATPVPAWPQQKLPTCTVSGSSALLENAFLRIEAGGDGRVRLTDKETGRVFEDLLILEDTGDIGNEYMYVAAQEAETVTTAGRPARLENISTGYTASVRLVHTLELPAEREGMKRSGQTKLQKIEIDLHLEAEARRLDVEVRLDNQIKDHRLRVLFPSDLRADSVYADAPFDVVERIIEPWSGWTNPTRSERMQSFFDLTDGSVGLAIAAEGLPEYEVLRDGRNTMALTLLRCVGELGDWNYFPTPGAQCIGPFTARFAIVPHRGDYRFALREAQAFNVPMRAVSTSIQGGSLSPELSWATVEGDPSVHLTALKKADFGDGLTLRLVNLGTEEQRVRMTGELFERSRVTSEANLSEQIIGPAKRENNAVCLTLPVKKIATVLAEGLIQ
ncbi:glycoside hydrolase family 38 C-terminal domain-containing protein [Cohnella sp. REN36]|uniref:alpha-mannosidase n=1 Tax=Cohnella sp. REN36 TaxID=2887347 RepID=UPI001D138D07|nr:glycoside hydrolase family 38 C-terminal domain-containing protein [Cohnella sp. REN36]MCC3371864.1 alpha-mannosidase [Cohnella sp. REN36]